MSLHGPGDNYGEIPAVSYVVRSIIRHVSVIKPEATSRTNDQYNLGHRKCKWTFTPLHESSVRIRHIWDHFPQDKHCIASSLQIYMENSNSTSPLNFPGYRSQCGVKNFPSEIISSDPLTVEIETNAPSDLNYQIDIVGTDAKECPAFSSNMHRCPDGACCTGTNCRSCVIELGTEPIGKQYI